MFMDDIKNRYTYLNTLKNVVWQEDRNYIEVPNRIVIIHPQIEPVINKLMRERPTWRFKCSTRFYSSDGPNRASRFDIFDGDEELGALWVDSHWRSGEARFYFNNFRLDKQRQRNTVSYTTKPDIAVKRIVKAFHMKTPSERAIEAQEAVRKAASTLDNDATWPLRKARSAIEGELVSYAMRHWDEVKHMLTPATQALNLPLLKENAEETLRLKAAINESDGVTVRIEPNGTYSLSRLISTAFDVVTCSDATLPDHVRGALGLLKMMDDKAFIADVGMRVNANLYFVMDKKGEG